MVRLENGPRSNDAFLGLSHDIFSFTMLQEIVARTLSVEVGTYKHAVGSLHLNDRNRRAARRYLEEGWQSTTICMPPMPPGDPWNSIGKVLRAEREIRLNRKVNVYDVCRSCEAERSQPQALVLHRMGKDRGAASCRPATRRPADVV